MVIVDADTSNPIQYAIIRVYNAASYPPSSLIRETWVGETQTDVNGEWLDPIFLDDGLNWVVQVSKRLTYSTQIVEIST
ncbi:MAG: hypothetical protein DRP83_00035 [Planctomycetota bacterium]|nr:MAG: hypothetical protein DRP83_00035 [Planctomycetota bacterium]